MRPGALFLCLALPGCVAGDAVMQETTRSLARSAGVPLTTTGVSSCMSGGPSTKLNAKNIMNTLSRNSATGGT